MVADITEEHFGNGGRKRMVGAAGHDKGKAVEKTSFQHEQLIDMILENPRVLQKELAERFGYSTHWISRLCNSDAFQARLAERKKELTDVRLARTVNARINSVAVQALEVLSAKLDASDSAGLALESLGIVAQVAAQSAIGGPEVPKQGMGRRGLGQGEKPE